MSDAIARLADIRLAIGRAEADARRPAGSVSLVAVSKTFAAEEIEPVLAAGRGVLVRTVSRRHRANGLI